MQGDSMKTKIGIGLLTVFLAAALLNGCGGGGGGSSTPSGGATADTTPPTVGALTATANSSSQINLSWSAATDNVGLNSSTPYRLFAAQGATPPAACTGTPIYQGTGTAYSNTGLTASTQYSYRLCVFDGADNSASTTASATTSASSGTVNPTTGSSAGTAVITTQRPIATQSDAARAADASVTIASQLSNSGITSLTPTIVKAADSSSSSGRHVMDIILGAQNKLSTVLQHKKTMSKTVHEVLTSPCTDGGSSTINMPTSTQMSITYTNCKELGSIKNGQFSISYTSDAAGNMTNGIFTLGSSPSNPYVEEFYSGTTYTTKTETERQYLNMTINSFSETTTSSSMDMSMNGYDEWYDYVANNSDKSEFTAFRIVYTSSDSLGTTTTDMTMSGSTKFSEYNGIVIAAANLRAFEDTTFQNFRLQDASNANGEQMRIDGTMAYVSHPECLSGTYVISTQVPITFNSSGTVTAGRITVNGIVITYNADGSVTATLNGTPVTIPNYTSACTLTQ